MSRARGRMSDTLANQRWPHQIMLPEAKFVGRLYPPIHDFCEGLDMDPLGHSHAADGVIYKVFAFAQREDAERFKATFGGEWTDREKRRGSRRRQRR